LDCLRLMMADDSRQHVVFLKNKVRKYKKRRVKTDISFKLSEMWLSLDAVRNKNYKHSEKLQQKILLLLLLLLMLILILLLLLLLRNDSSVLGPRPFIFLRQTVWPTANLFHSYWSNTVYIFFFLVMHSLFSKTKSREVIRTEYYDKNWNKLRTRICLGNCQKLIRCNLT
jgi:hypothetical protein